MGRPRDPRRDAAFKMYNESKGEMLLKDIAKKLGVGDSAVRKWKSQDEWADKVTFTPNSNVTKKKSNATKKKGAPYGNHNSRGPHKSDGKIGNQNARKHGLYSKYLPKRTQEIFEQLEDQSPLAMLENLIKISYANYLDAQEILEVEGKGDVWKELKKRTDGAESTTEEWNFHFPYERVEGALKARAKAEGELRNLIKQYNEMKQDSLVNQEREARINKIIAETNRINGTDTEGEGDDGFLEAMEESVAEVWADESEEES